MCLLLTDRGKLRIVVSCNKAVTLRGDSFLQAGQFLNNILHASAFCSMLIRSCWKVNYSTVDCSPSNVCRLTWQRYSSAAWIWLRSCIVVHHTVLVMTTKPLIASIIYAGVREYGERFSCFCLNFMIFTCSQWLCCISGRKCHREPVYRNFPLVLYKRKHTRGGKKQCVEVELTFNMARGCHCLGVFCALPNNRSTIDLCWLQFEIQQASLKQITVS